MRVENLDLKQDIDDIRAEVDTFDKKIKDKLKYVVPLQLYSGNTYKTSYKLSNSLVNDLSMYDFILIRFRIYNYDAKQITGKCGSYIAPVISDTNFAISYRWQVNTEIWESVSQFSIDMTNKVLNCDIADGTWRPMITGVYGIADSALILGL